VPARLESSSFPRKRESIPISIDEINMDPRVRGDDDLGDDSSRNRFTQKAKLAVS